MAKFLVIRFSALGDVAMTIPVIYSFATQYPEHQVTVVSKKVYAPLFTGLPVNVDFFGVDFKKDHKGFAGLGHLYNQLKRERFDYVIDLNCVLRSLILISRFMLSGKSVSIIRKEKRKQQLLTRKRYKKIKPLKSTFQHYQEAFIRIGFSFNLNFNRILIHPDEMSDIIRIFGEKEDNTWIGIAPFAKEKGKIYPIELQEEVLKYFTQRKNTKIFLFGGGKDELDVFHKWADKYPSITIVAGKVNMHQEVLLMSRLNVMLSMDSSNMHLASLAGIPVISVWGATHPYSGFLGWKQKEENVVQIPLDCRPCSSHGTKPCYKGTWQCLYDIRPSMIIGKIEKLLNEPSV